MEKISLPFFYQLGSALNAFAETNIEDTKKIDFLVSCLTTRNKVVDLFKTFSLLKVCRATGNELIKVCDEIWESAQQAGISKFVEAEGIEANFYEAVQKAKQFEIVLSAELEILSTYHATQKGIYSTTDLIDQAEKMLPLSILEKMDEASKGEIRESGKCLAFDLATASAFHIMRATEAVMHEYYVLVCKLKPIPEKRLDSWGEYIAEFHKSEDSHAKQVAALLQQVKDLHRNPIMHPEVVLNLNEAFELFEITKSAIIAMVSRFSVEKNNDKPTKAKGKAKT